MSKQKKNKKRSGAFRRRKTSGRMSRKLVALFLGVMLVFVALAIDITYVNTVENMRNELKFVNEDGEDRKSTRLNSSHKHRSRMPSSA